MERSASSCCQYSMGPWRWCKWCQMIDTPCLGHKILTHLITLRQLPTHRRSGNIPGPHSDVCCQTQLDTSHLEKMPKEHLYIPELLTTNLNHFIESDELLTSPVPLTLQTLGSKKELYHVVPHLWQSHCLKQRSHVSFRKVKTSDEILLDQKNGYEICSMTDETDIHLCSVVYWWRVVIFYTDVLHWCVGILMYWLVSPI